ncbi:MAG: iron ABC transporter permease [Deltaproteobacteria bacterium]|nr:iron ABC transporter permease [Deltaproteobacteria bacterium]
MALALVAAVLVSLTLGRYPLGLGDLAYFFGHLAAGGEAADPSRWETLYNVLINIRLPRILAAVLIGSSLSVSGAAYQAMFVNPLVSPGLLGVLAGASFGAALGIVFAQTWLAVQALAFACGLLAVLAALALASMYRGERILMLILGGVISGALFTSLLAVIKYLADPYDQLPAIVYWLMGGLSMADGHTVWTMGGPMLGGVLLLMLLGNYLNVLSMGDEEARSLGVNVSRLRLLLIFLATLVSALTVAMGGMIGWVGLVIPHIARMLVGPDNRVLLPAATLVGGTYLLIVDDLARLMFSTEVPLGILTSLVGIPFFALVLRKAKKGWQ